MEVGVRESVISVVRKFVGVPVRYVKVSRAPGGSLHVKLHVEGPIPIALVNELAELLARHGEVHIHAPHRNAIRLDARPAQHVKG